MFLFALVPLALLAFAAFALVGFASLGFGLAFFGVKLLFLAAFIGIVAGLFRRGPHPGRYDAWAAHGPPWRQRQASNRHAPPRPTEEMFEEWHRMAHAREEVDSWAPDTD